MCTGNRADSQSISKCAREIQRVRRQYWVTSCLVSDTRWVTGRLSRKQYIVSLYLHPDSTDSTRSISIEQGVLTLMAVERPEEFEQTPTDKYQDNWR